MIEDLCQEKGVHLNIPPFILNDAQLTDAELVQSSGIASLRVHVERAMERIKNFHFLDFFPVSHLDIAGQLFFVCAVLSDFDKRWLTAAELYFFFFFFASIYFTRMAR